MGVQAAAGMSLDTAGGVGVQIRGLVHTSGALPDQAPSGPGPKTLVLVPFPSNASVTLGWTFGEGPSALARLDVFGIAWLPEHAGALGYQALLGGVIGVGPDGRVRGGGGLALSALHIFQVDHAEPPESRPTGGAASHHGAGHDRRDPIWTEYADGDDTNAGNRHALLVVFAGHIGHHDWLRAQLL
jgi:hypothetical protein